MSQQKRCAKCGHYTQMLANQCPNCHEIFPISSSCPTVWGNFSQRTTEVLDSAQFVNPGGDFEEPQSTITSGSKIARPEKNKTFVQGTTEVLNASQFGDRSDEANLTKKPTEVLEQLQEEQQESSPQSSSATIPPPQDELIGRVFGRCRVKQKIGEGAMGKIYKAFHQTLDKTVVLKILPTSLASSEELTERFMREARACAKIHHQNVVQVLDAGYEHGIYFYIMEYVDGASLEDLIKEGKTFSERECCEVIRDAAVALEIAHQEGIIHRDIKASNIMITQQGQIKVADFGLACNLSDTRISVAGQIMGTPQYMSPEQWDGCGVDERSDLYSLGITFFYLLAGNLPFDSGSTVSLFKKHVTEKPPSLQKIKSVSPMLERIVMRLLEKDKNNRYKNAKELVDALNEFLKNPNQKAPARKWRVASMLFVFIAVLGYLGYTQREYFLPAQKDSQQVSQNTSNSQNNHNNPQNTDNNSQNTGNNSQNTNKQPQNTSETTNPVTEDSDNLEDNNPSDNQGNNNTQTNENPDLEQTTPDKDPDASSNENINGQNDPVESQNPENHLENNPPVEKLPELPTPSVVNSKIIVKQLPYKVEGKLNAVLPKNSQVVILLRSAAGKTQQLACKVINRQFHAVLSNITEGQYWLLPQVQRTLSGNNDSKIGKKCRVFIDLQAPSITVETPQNAMVFYEDKSGNQIKVSAQIKDSMTGIKVAYIVHQKRKIPMRIVNGKYQAQIKLAWGVQHYKIIAVDKVRHTATTASKVVLVPKGMIRIPGGNVQINNKQTVFRAFYIDKTEVTNEEYANYLRLSNAEPPLRWPSQQQQTAKWQKLPVVFVSYQEAMAYSKYFSKRLPSEAEWTVAALWNQQRLLQYPWGDSAQDVEWSSQIMPVGTCSQDQSFFQVMDMATNVSEWTADEKEGKVVRKGGNFLLSAKVLPRMKWASVNFLEEKDSRTNWLGFRCVFSEEQ